MLPIVKNLFLLYNWPPVSMEPVVSDSIYYVGKLKVGISVLSIIDFCFLLIL